MGSRSVGSMAVLVSFLMASAVMGADEKVDSKVDPLVVQEKQAEAVMPSLVVVEYTLQYDKGEAPRGGQYSEDLASSIKDERPMEEPGFLVGGKTVLTRDMMIHPRFVKSIAVRKGGQVVEAKISGYAKTTRGVFLELGGELKEGKALAFDAGLAGPLSVVNYEMYDGAWSASVNSFSANLTMNAGRKVATGVTGVVVDKTGKAVGVNLGGEMPVDGSWKGDPVKWPQYSAAEMEKLLGGLEKATASTIVRVTLNFRSPKSLSGGGMRGGDDGGATVQQVLGVVVDSNRVLVLAELKPNVTARLERIRVQTEPPVDAKFTATLTDFGVIVATVEKPFASYLSASKEKLESLVGTTLPLAEIVLQGEKRVAYFEHGALTDLNIGWKRNLYPTVIGGGNTTFVFDGANGLVALPVSKREKASVQERYRSDYPTMTAYGMVASAVADLEKNSDKQNVPLTEEEENRVAWLGLELQPLNQELARASNVSDQTNDGEMGALVTYVYPGSPAAKAGIEMGDILLRVDAEGQPKPIDVKIEQDYMYTREFPWDRLGEAPESVFDRIPTPWQPVENGFIRTLTDLGFGKKFTAEVFHDGKLVKKDFTVTEGPAHYASAAKYKDEKLGITVRDLTFEVRRYLQKKDDEPGVVIGKIELGSKASLAGLKPYELITHVNDQPVKDVKEYEKLTKDQKELRLTMKRKTKGRIVKVTLAAETQPAATKAAEKGAEKAGEGAGEGEK